MCAFQNNYHFDDIRISGGDVAAPTLKSLKSVALHGSTISGNYWYNVAEQSRHCITTKSIMGVVASAHFSTLRNV